jgi:nucleotide-binding universal stress UspA family protein
VQIATVLIATDFSQTGERAARAGAAIARRHGARVVLAHVVRPPRLGRATPFFPLSMDRSHIEEALRAEALDRLRALRETLLPDVAGVALELTDHPRAAVAINDLADHHDADLVVVGTHALEGLARVVARSTAERTMRAARRPMLVVTPDASIEVVVRGDVVVGVDDSMASLAATRWAGAWAAMSGGSLTLFHTDVIGAGDVMVDELARQQALGETRRGLWQLAAQHVPPGVGVIVEANLAGDVVSSLLERTRRGDGLIVVGSQRPTGPWRATTAQQLVRRSLWPIVVVPDPLPLGRDLDFTPRRDAPRAFLA